MISEKDICFTVCCKHDGSNNLIHDCVKSILKTYPQTNIVIVDSCSTDKKYMLQYSDNDNICIEDIGNTNYEYGAIVHSFKKYKDKYKTFVFMQDSMLLKDKINELDDLGGDYLAFKDEKSGWWCDVWAHDYFYEMHKDFPHLPKNNFQMVIWNTFAINTSTFDRVINSDLFYKIQPPINKMGSEYMERVWSILFSYTDVGYKVNTTSIHKIFAGRK